MAENRLLDPEVETRRLNRLIEEVGKESDRAAVILVAAELDICVRECLEAFFVEPSSTSNKYGFTLFGPDEAAGTFAARIELAYRSGLIAEWCQRELHVIRRLRNRFAHEALGFSLQSSEATNLIKQLNIPVRLSKADSDEFNGQFWEDPRQVMATAGGVLLAELICIRNNLVTGVDPRLERCERDFHVYSNEEGTG